MKFDSIGEFFTYAVHVVFGVVIGQSFFNSATVLVPVTNFANHAAALTAYQMVLVYFLIITSWIGFFMSTNKAKYSEGRLGMARFGTDFFILFLYYYLIILISRNVGGHGDLFIYGLPAIFGTYLLWDFLKVLDIKREAQELANQIQMKIDIRSGLLTTEIWFGAFLMLSFLYIGFQTLTDSETRERFEFWIDVLATTGAIALIACYRIVKLRPTKGGSLPLPRIGAPF